MSSKAVQISPASTALLCQVGERVYLSPADAGGPELERISSGATRQLDLAAGEKSFRLHQLPLDFKDERAGHSDMRSFGDQAGLTSGETTALLRSLFGTGGPMLRLQSDPVFIALARSVASEPGLLRAVIGFDVIDGFETAIATIPMRAGFKTEDILVSLSQDRLAIGRIASVHDFLARESAQQRFAALSFASEPPAGDYLLIGAAGLVRLEVKLRLHESAQSFFRDYETSNPDFIGVYTQADDEAAIVLNRLLRLAPPSPVVDEPLLSLQFLLDTAIPLGEGLFASGWFHDPERRIAGVTAVDHGLEDPDISAAWKLFEGRADILGRIVPVKRFVAFLPRAKAGVPTAQVTVRLLLTNGESHLVRAAPVPADLVTQRDRVLDCIAAHALDTDMLAEVFLPALAPIQDELNARQSVREVRQFGRRSTRTVSLVIPLYKETGFIRSQLMAFAVDPYIRAHCELVYVLDDPLIAIDVASLIEGLAMSLPLDLKLVILDRNGGYAMANNMGVGEAEGETLVLMNSDVISDRHGWIEEALARLKTLPRYSVIGPKLLYADDSLQHAGMYFHRLSSGQWQNVHYWKGYGRDFGPAGEERVVPAVTGACMVIHKADYADVGGFSTDYITGDFEDSDLCLKLRARNGLPLYMPSIELYHFERQSMPAETEGQGRGSSIYNCALHTARWSDAMTELLAGMSETTDAG